jgi:hypothetical protein
MRTSRWRFNPVASLRRRMMDPRLLADAAVDAAVAVVYEVVGYRLSRHRVAGDSRAAFQGFAIWWQGLAATGALAAVLSLVVAFDALPLAGLRVLGFLLGIPFVVGLAGLVFYLSYLFTGRRSLLWPIAGVYALYELLQVWQALRSSATGVFVRNWRPTLAIAPPASATFTALSLLLLLVPPLAGAIAYLGLLGRTSDATSRYRIGMVAGSILAWLASVLAISIPVALGDAWQVASRAVVIASALALYLAYRPPRWVRERYGVEALM